MLRKIWSKLVERWRFLSLPYGQVAYGQNAEDLVLSKFLDEQLKDKNYQGFYIDLGAHHPFRYSNTLLFYQKGWRGLNIDADPRAINLLNVFRSKDINVLALLGGKKHKRERLSYFIFKDRAFNTADEFLARQLIESGRSQLLEEIRMEVRNINTLFEKYLKKGQRIDFLTIDLEGLDFEVLESLDIKKFHPEYVLIEDLSLEDKKITLFLKEQGYCLVSRVFNTMIWQSRDQLLDFSFR